MATTSASSLVILSSFHPRFRMSVRQPMSFSHSAALARKTRRSATFSQCGGDGGAVRAGGVQGPNEGEGGSRAGELFLVLFEAEAPVFGVRAPSTPARV